MAHHPRIGYARVSTLDQDLDGQVARLTAEGCSLVRSEKVSGGSREGRAELATILAFLRPGDELVVTRLDRFGRDTRDVLNLIHEAEGRGAFVTVLDPHVSTRGELGHIVVTVLRMVAQMERRFIKERHRAGERRRRLPRRQAPAREQADRDAFIPHAMIVTQHTVPSQITCCAGARRQVDDGHGASGAVLSRFGDAPTRFLGRAGLCATAGTCLMSGSAGDPAGPHRFREVLR